MSSEEADLVEQEFERKWDSKHTKAFIVRMEHKLHRKERAIRY
jgi:hypothetical protein